MNSTSVNLHRCYSNHIFLHNFKLPDVSDFWVLLVKILYFFYYTSTDASVYIHRLVFLTEIFFFFLYIR